MKFAVADLKSLSTGIPWLSARERKALSTRLRRRQPEFWEIIDEVSADPRCAEAYRFCAVFCALSLRHAEAVAGCRLPIYPGDVIWETAGFMARSDEASIGRRACGFRKRLLRHVLTPNPFDEDDTEWLCTTISTFLFLVENSPGRETTANKVDSGGFSFWQDLSPFVLRPPGQANTLLAPWPFDVGKLSAPATT
jgi:hypothetical protein